MAVRERSFLIWLLLGAALLAVLNLPESLSRKAKSSVREIVAPLQSLISSTMLTIRQTRDFVRGLGGTAIENQQLNAELIRLRGELRYLRELEQENVDLRHQLDFISRAERELIATEVVARDISGWWQTMRLSKGLNDGIVPGLAVVTADGLVGRTVDISAKTSDILLISDPACKVSAQLSRTGTFGIVSGRGVSWNGQVHCRMEFISKNIPVRPGDEVVTSGLGGIYPAGILIGYVDRVELDKKGLYQYADIVPTADIGALRYAFVVIETIDPIEALLRRRGPFGGRDP